MKRIFAVLIAILLLFVSISALAVDLSEKIYDNADLFTAEEITNLQANALSINSRHSLDVVVLTEARSISGPLARATEFFDGNNFGIGEHGDGIMLYVNMNTRDVYILTTGHAEPLFERHIESMLDNITPHLGSGDYHTAAQTFLNLTDNLIERNGGLPDYIYPPDLVPTPISKHITFSLIVGICVGLFVTIILLAIHKRSLPKPPSYHTYLGDEGVKTNHTTDQFISTHTTRTAIPKSSSSSGGSSGGGGRSHGGGGRKF